MKQMVSSAFRKAWVRACVCVFVVATTNEETSSLG